MLNLRYVQSMHSAMRGNAGHSADQPHHWNPRRMSVISRLDTVNHGIEATLAAACRQHNHGSHHRRQPHKHQHSKPHLSKSSSLSHLPASFAAFLRDFEAAFGIPKAPPRALSLSTSIGPRISTSESSRSSASST